MFSHLMSWSRLREKNYRSWSRLTTGGLRNPECHKILLLPMLTYSTEFIQSCSFNKCVMFCWSAHHLVPATCIVYCLYCWHCNNKTNSFMNHGVRDRIVLDDLHIDRVNINKEEKANIVIFLGSVMYVVVAVQYFLKL